MEVRGVSIFCRVCGNRSISTVLRLSSCLLWSVANAKTKGPDAIDCYVLVRSHISNRSSWQRRTYTRFMHLRLLFFYCGRCTLRNRGGSSCFWSTAIDVPLSRDDETRSAESLRTSRKRWLTYTEAKTAGLCGILPLCVGLPIRFTETIDFEHGACKHAMGELTGWSVEEPLSREAEVCAAEIS